MWFLGSFFGSLCLILLNTLSKLFNLNCPHLLIISALSLTTTYCFWFAWRHSFSFLGLWFLQSALVSAGAFFVNYFIIQQEVPLLSWVGIGLILLGMVFLRI